MDQDQSVKREITIKLLLRCKLMYEARANVRRILKLIVKKEREIDPWLASVDKLNMAPSENDT